MDSDFNKGRADAHVKKNKIRSYVWIAIFLLSSSLFILTWIIQPLLLYVGHWDLLQSAEKPQKIQVPLFDSRGQDGLNVPQKFALKNTHMKSNNETLDIQFNFMFHSLKDLENLFQTGVANEGIRVESDQKGDLVIVVGANNPAGYVSAIITHVFYPLFYTIAPNTWHTIRIHTWNQHAVAVWLDGIRVVNIIDPAIKWRVTEIKVGRGFGEERPFDGKIADFELKRSWFHSSYQHTVKFVLSVLSVLTFIFSVFAFIKCLPARLSKEEKIAWLSTIVLIGFVAMVSYNFIASVYLGMSYPFNSFLFLASTPFSDYYLLPILIENLNPYYGPVAEGALYFPFAYLFNYPAVWFPHFYLILMNLSFVITLFLFVRHYFSLSPTNSIIKLMNAKNIFILVFLTYPFLFAFERGNTEVIIFSFIASALYFYHRQHYYKSAFLIGLGAAMKLFPILMVLLFFSEKKYKPVLFSGMIFLGLTGFSLLCLQGGFYHNLTGLITTIRNTDHTYSLISVLSLAGMPGHWPSVELLSIIKVLYFKLTHKETLSMEMVTAYHFLTLMGFAAIALYILFIQELLWKKVMLIICAMLLFPILSFQYKLIYLYLPLAFFINQTKTRQEKRDNYYLILFALMMIPTNYFYTKDGIFSLSSIIDTTVMLIFMADIMLRGVYREAYYFFGSREKIVQKNDLTSMEVV